jgi:hypothetical protein
MIWALLFKTTIPKIPTPDPVISSSGEQHCGERARVSINAFIQWPTNCFLKWPFCLSHLQLPLRR